MFDKFKNIMTKERRQSLITSSSIAAILLVLFNFALDWRKESRVDFEVLLERQAAEIQELKAEIALLRVENQQLRDRYSMLSSVNYESPVAMWVKDLDGRMVSLNRRYEELFLQPNEKDRYDYIGKTDLEFWGEIMRTPEDAERYRQNDLQVIQTRRVMRFTEYAYVDGQRIKLIVYKYPWWSDSPDWNGKTVMGTGGVAVIAECD